MDAGESTIKPLTRIVKKYRGKLTIMMGSGLRLGPDAARALASDVKFTCMYGLAALGNNGGNHTIPLLKQVMEQICSEKTKYFPHHHISK